MFHLSCWQPPTARPPEAACFPQVMLADGIILLSPAGLASPSREKRMIRDKGHKPWCGARNADLNLMLASCIPAASASCCPSAMGYSRP